MTYEQLQAAKAAFKPETWELAKAIIYSLSLPFALLYHMRELRHAMEEGGSDPLLNRRVNEHQNGVRCACSLFMSTMEAWRAHLGLGETEFLAHCERVVRRLHSHIPLILPEQFQPTGFTALYRFMKQSGIKARGDSQAQ